MLDGMGRFLFLAVLLLVGCRQARANSALREYESMLNPRVGVADKAELIAVLGVPQHCEAAMGSEYCRFRRSYGIQTAGFGNGQSGQVYGRSWESYDQIDVQFDTDGKLVWWSAQVQR